MKYFLLIFFCFAQVSCICLKDHEVDTTTSPTPAIEKAEEIKADAPEQIENSVSKAESNIEEIETYIRAVWSTGELNEKQSSSLKRVESNVEELKSEIENIGVNNTKVIASYEWIKEAARLSKERDKQFTHYKSQATEANTKAKKERDEKLNNLVIGSIILIVLSIIAGINGSSKAWMGVVGGITTIIICSTIMYYFENLKYIGGIAVVVTIALVALKVKRDKELKKANEEIIHSTEVIKNELSDDKKKELFGEGAKPGLLFNIQSTSTENIVKDTRKKKKDNWTKII